jgi:poly-gamma-glutamate synthesis protein (capsule biosynthesis protein)
LGDGYVAYGLGNYAWYTQASDATSMTGVLTLTVRPGPSRAGRARVTDAVWDPARIGANGLPRPMDDSAAAGFGDTRDELRDCAGLTP